MIRTTGRILKSEDAELQGQCRLDVPQLESARAAAQKPGAASGPARACILESHPDYALIEVTCSCGAKMVLKCDYAGAQAPANPQTQKGAGAASGQKK
jgi:hypothetical protein